MVSVHCRTCLKLRSCCQMLFLRNMTCIRQPLMHGHQLFHSQISKYQSVSQHGTYSGYCWGQREIHMHSSLHKSILEEELGNSINLEKKIDIYLAEHQKSISLRPDQPPNPHVLKVCIIGAPNAGKSTLANQLIGWRFSSVSKKVHTTRHNSVGILSEGHTQVVFLDTPGLITLDTVKKHKLEKTLLTDPYSALFEADLIIAVVDVSQVWNRSRLDRDVLIALTLHSDKKSILVLNKVDQVKDKLNLLEISRLLTEGVVGGEAACHYSASNGDDVKLTADDILNRIRQRERKEQQKLEDAEQPSLMDEDEHDLDLRAPKRENMLPSEWWKNHQKVLRRVKKVTQNTRGWKYFEKMFYTSALNADGTSDVKQYLLDLATPGPWLYHGNMVTDISPSEIVKMCVREKLLDNLPNEIPYRLEIEIKHWELEYGVLRTRINLICDRKRDIVSVLGKNGSTIRKISAEVKQDLMNTFKHEMTVHLVAVPRENHDWQK